VIVLIVGGVAAALVATGADDKRRPAHSTRAKPKEVGNFPDREVPDLVGYLVPVPGFLPSDLRRTSDRVTVFRKRRQVDVGWKSDERRGGSPRGLSITKGRKGKTVLDLKGIDNRRRQVTVQGDQALVDSWTEVAPGKGDPEHRYRFVRWDKSGFTYFVVGENVPDEELLKIAESL